MGKIDLKHIAFHTLVGLFIIWAAIFIVLLALVVANGLNNNNPEVGSALSLWICMNLFTGGALFIVIRLFGERPKLTRIIRLVFFGLGMVAVMLLAFLWLRP